LFPKSYDTLINVLLRELMNRVGPDEVENILESLSTQLAKEYNLQVSGAELSERLNALRHALEARGIPAEVHPSGDGFQLFACPYHDVAQEHAGVCTMERRMLEQVLGETIQIEGTIRDGHRSCQFSVGKPQ
jgi:predicted ArsR family transcriptional regulator